jgi:hypothetical protein
VAAWAAAGAKEDQGRRVATGWQLPADGLHHQRGQGNLADAGVALGTGLEAAAEPAGVIAGVNDLEHGQGAVQVDAAAAQSGQLPEPQSGAEQAQHVVPPEQRELGQQATSFLAVFDYAMSLCTVVRPATADSSAATPATSAAAAAKGSGLVPPPRIAPAIVVAAVYGR